MYNVISILPNQYRPKIIYFFTLRNIQIFVLLPTKVLKWSLPLFGRELFVDNISEFLPNTKYTDTYK